MWKFLDDEATRWILESSLLLRALELTKSDA
jgi:hypothetical protein